MRIIYGRKYIEHAHSIMGGGEDADEKKNDI